MLFAVAAGKGDLVSATFMNSREAKHLASALHSDAFNINCQDIGVCVAIAPPANVCVDGTCPTG